MPKHDLELALRQAQASLQQNHVTAAGILCITEDGVIEEVWINPEGSCATCAFLGTASLSYRMAELVNEMHRRRNPE